MVGTGLSTRTVGGTAKPVYINDGVATALSATVGSNTGGEQIPVYLNAGTITAMSTTTGGEYNPVYLNAGKITKSKIPNIAVFKGNNNNESAPDSFRTNTFVTAKMTTATELVNCAVGTDYKISTSGAIVVLKAGTYKINGAAYIVMSQECAPVFAGVYIKTGSNDVTSATEIAANRDYIGGSRWGSSATNSDNYKCAVPVGPRTITLAANDYIHLAVRCHFNTNSGLHGVLPGNVSSFLQIERVA